RPWSEVDRAQLDAWAQTPIDFHFPGGEHLQDFAQRVFAIGEQMQNSQGTVVCITHAGVIRLLLAQAQHQPWHACLSVAVPLAAVFEVKNGTYGQL
ncbi:MAG: histidine phosphatase family protein, partial [Reinekea sp.]|nr:histidine phosphatase family protein [Reinekea sp.]